MREFEKLWSWNCSSFSSLSLRDDEMDLFAALHLCGLYKAISLLYFNKDIYLSRKRKEWANFQVEATKGFSLINIDLASHYYYFPLF